MLAAGKCLTFLGISIASTDVSVPHVVLQTRQVHVYICLGTSVHNSSEMYQHAELTGRQLTAYAKHDVFVSFGFTQISRLSRWGWWIAQCVFLDMVHQF